LSAISEYYQPTYTRHVFPKTGRTDCLSASSTPIARVDVPSGSSRVCVCVCAKVSTRKNTPHAKLPTQNHPAESFETSPYTASVFHKSRYLPPSHTPHQRKTFLPTLFFLLGEERKKHFPMVRCVRYLVIDVLTRSRSHTIDQFRTTIPSTPSKNRFGTNRK
jgi:hypothetical protein